MEWGEKSYQNAPTKTQLICLQGCTQLKTFKSRPDFRVEKFYSTPKLLEISNAESLEIMTHSVKSNTFKIQVLIS